MKIYKNYHVTDPQLKGIHVYHFGFNKDSYPSHRHEEEYMLSLPIIGSAHTIEKNKTDSLVRPGEIALMNPKQVHSGIVNKETGLRYKSYHIHQDVLKDAMIELNETEGFPFFQKYTIENDRELFLLWLNLSNLIGTNCSLLEKETLLLEACTMLISRYTNSKKKRFGKKEPVAVKRAKEYILDNLYENVGLGDVAKAAGISRGHLIKIFKEYIGIPPHKFRRQEKVERAKKLIIKGINPTNIEGFSDHSHLIREIFTFTKITPSNFTIIKNQNQ